MPLRAAQLRPIIVSASFNKGDQETRHDVPYNKQEQPNWCWAACTDMLLDHFDRPEVSQCEIATLFLKGVLGADCCNDQKACDKSCRVEDIRTIYNQWGLDCKQSGPLTPALLRQAVRAGPVQVGVQWKGGTSKHVLIVYGFVQDGRDEKWLYIDPRCKMGFMDSKYNGLLHAFGLGSWNWTWYEIERK
jgi:hypothetical protein